MSFSYFIVDTILGVIQRYNDFWMNLHHAIIFIVYAVALRDNNVATELIITIFFGELTNPFNLLRQIYAEQEKPQQARLQGILFIASFMLFRIVLGPIFVWWICSNVSVSIIIKLGACLMRKSLSLILVWIGYIWAWRIMVIAAQQISEMKLPTTETPGKSLSQRVQSMSKFQTVWNILSLGFCFSSLIYYQSKSQ